MIEIKNVSYSYENAVTDGALKNVSLCIPQGQTVLLCGESGSGKTTFGRLVNGLIPCYYEGKLTGSVMVNGNDTTQLQLHELAGTVGSVFQNPKSQFYTLLTDTEIIFACENIGMEKREILRRFTETVQDFRLEKLLGNNVSQFSGGEKQKIACASVSMLRPPILVLDEPTSNLDISAIRELREIVAKWKATGKTVLIAEHRLWWLRGLVDRVAVFQEGSIVEDVPADEFWRRTPDELHAEGLRGSCRFAPQVKERRADAQYIISPFRSSDGEFTLNIPELKIPKGAVVAVLGNNGAGKSTFARCLCGLVRKCKVQIIDGEKRYAGRKLSSLAYMVFQDVNHQLFSESVSEDVTLGLRLPRMKSVPLPKKCCGAWSFGAIGRHIPWRCRVDRSRGLPSQAHWRHKRILSSTTNPPAVSTTATWSAWQRISGASLRWEKRSSSSPTTQSLWRNAATDSCSLRTAKLPTRAVGRQKHSSKSERIL